MPRYRRADPPFRRRVGQIVFVPTHHQHCEVIERDRTNDGESQVCPPVYSVQLNDDTIVHGLRNADLKPRRDR